MISFFTDVHLILRYSKTKLNKRKTFCYAMNEEVDQIRSLLKIKFLLSNQRKSFELWKFFLFFVDEKTGMTAKSHLKLC